MKYTEKSEQKQTPVYSESFCTAQMLHQNNNARNRCGRLL